MQSTSIKIQKTRAKIAIPTHIKEKNIQTIPKSPIIVVKVISKLTKLTLKIYLKKLNFNLI